MKTWASTIGILTPYQETQMEAIKKAYPDETHEQHCHRLAMKTIAKYI